MGQWNVTCSLARRATALMLTKLGRNTGRGVCIRLAAPGATRGRAPGCHRRTVAPIHTKPGTYTVQGSWTRIVTPGVMCGPQEPHQKHTFAPHQTWHKHRSRGLSVMTISQVRGNVWRTAARLRGPRENTAKELHKYGELQKCNSSV